LFGYFADAEWDLEVLRNLPALLKPGGTVMSETVGEEIAGRDLQTHAWHRQAERNE
jgi:hypothetical protein